MYKREIKKSLKSAQKNPLLEKLKAKRKRSISLRRIRNQTIYQAVTNSK